MSWKQWLAAACVAASIGCQSAPRQRVRVATERTPPWGHDLQPGTPLFVGILHYRVQLGREEGLESIAKLASTEKLEDAWVYRDGYWYAVGSFRHPNAVLPHAYYCGGFKPGDEIYHLDRDNERKDGLSQLWTAFPSIADGLFFLMGPQVKQGVVSSKGAILCDMPDRSEAAFSRANDVYNPLTISHRLDELLGNGRTDEQAIQTVIDELNRDMKGAIVFTYEARKKAVAGE